jgi:hypothetical protein
MTTPRKTASEISAAIIAQLENSLNTTIPLLPKSFCRVLAKALGGVFVLLYQFAGFTLLQVFPKTASNEPMTIGGYSITPLKMWGSLVGVNQKTGQRAEYTISITVLTQGGTLSSGERIVNPATEMIYTIIGDVSLNAATVSATIRATVAGELGSVDVGTTLNFVSPPAAVEKEVSVTVEVAPGVDPETTEEYRERVLERWAARPQGGAYADYRDWAEEVEGVRNAYPYSGWYDASQFSEPWPETSPMAAAGQVFVFIESSSHTDGVPPALGPGGRPPNPETGGLLQDVFDNIEADSTGLANRRNVNAYVRVYPIRDNEWDGLDGTGGRTEFDVNVIALASVEDENTAKDAIKDGVTDYFTDREPYITGLAIPPRKDIISNLTVGAVCGQIAASKGGTIRDIEVSLDGTPIPDGLYYLQEGEKSKLGTISFDGVPWT